MHNPSLTTDYVIVGKIGTTYGIKGWLKIHSFTEARNNILTYDPWYIEDTSDWKKIELKGGREHGAGIVAKLAGFDTPETARQLTGKHIAVLRSQLPTLTKEEYYWNDLIGLTVINHHHKILGKIIYLMETGANDVLVVKGEKEHAIPYLPGKVIKDIRLVEHVMHVDWDEM